MSRSLLKGCRESGHPWGWGKGRGHLASFFLCVHACASHWAQSYALILPHPFLSRAVWVIWSSHSSHSLPLARGGERWAPVICSHCDNVTVQQAGNPKSFWEQWQVSGARKWQAWAQPLVLNTKINPWLSDLWVTMSRMETGILTVHSSCPALYQPPHFLFSERFDDVIMPHVGTWETLKCHSGFFPELDNARERAKFDRGNPPIGRAMESVSVICVCVNIETTNMLLLLSLLRDLPITEQTVAFPKVYPQCPGRQQQCQGQENVKMYPAYPGSTLAQREWWRPQLDIVVTVLSGGGEVFNGLPPRCHVNGLWFSHVLLRAETLSAVTWEAFVPASSRLLSMPVAFEIR